MSADNLPRPSTPGPWAVSTDAGEDSAEVICTNPGLDFIHTVALRQHNDDMAVSWPDGVEPSGAHPDIYAIAALPERIRRMDAVRAYCEGGHRHVSAAHVLSLLDGEGAGE